MDKATILARGIRQPSGCFTWPGAHNNRGYGTVHHDGRMWLVHRLVYTFKHGSIGPGLQVCHRCDVRDCYEVEHLFAGTAQDNILDMHAKGREAVPLLRGEAHGGSTLTEAIVHDLRRRFEAGESQSALAREHGIAQTTVSRIVRRQAWTHV